VAVVTGAGSPDGIGFATARLLAELGAAVLISAFTVVLFAGLWFALPLVNRRRMGTDPPPPASAAGPPGGGPA